MILQNPRTPSRIRPARWALAAAVTGLASILGGCHTEGGIAYSLDKFTYVSTSWRPWTVTLKDTRTGQDFWSVDVPVGKQLVVEFLDKQGTKDGFTPDLMKWALMDAGDIGGRLDNSLPVPAQDARRLDTTIRAAPELPDGMSPNKKPPTGTKSPAGKTTAAANMR